jgi:hypothetical protein
MGIIAQLIFALPHAESFKTYVLRSGSSNEDHIRRLADRPIGMPEMIMASAFLDFGGMPDERFLHEWRIPRERANRHPQDRNAGTRTAPD